MFVLLVGRDLYSLIDFGRRNLRGRPTHSDGYPQPSSGYLQPSSWYPEPSSAYPELSSGYPELSGGYPQPSSEYSSTVPPVGGVSAIAKCDLLDAP